MKNIEEFYKKHIEPEFKVELCSTGIENNIWSNKYRDGEEDAQILAGNDYPNALSFSHEMLHLYLYANEFSTLGNWFISFPDAYNRLNSCLINSNGFMDEISNAIAHIKMLPIFTKKLGLPKSSFFANWDRLIKDSDILKLNEEYHHPHTENDIHFTNFIKYYFITRYHFNDDLIEEYEKYDSDLKKIDETLHKILSSLCSVWDNAPTNYNNVQFFHDLHSGLEKYLKTN